MIETVSIFTKLDELVVYDADVIGTEIDEESSDKISVSNLNQANNQFKFHFSADFDYLLSSPNTGFLIKARFRTRSNTNTDANANMTLASNWLGYLFDDFSLRLGGEVIEFIHSLE